VPVPGHALKYDPVAVADQFINLGAVGEAPSTQSCDNYVKLFLPNAILHSPGVPDASGSDAIRQNCLQSHAAVSPAINFQVQNINVTSWNTEKRTAFSWYINGVRTSDGEDVQAPAISCLFQNPAGIIQYAWSFFDDTLIQGRERPRDQPFNSTAIVKYYTNLGNYGSSATMRNCSLWASLFEADGISQEPGVPPIQGYDKLFALCQRRVARWKIFIPSTQLELPVMSWNTEKRVAFQWTLSGVTTDGQTHVVPAISMLLMSSDGLIQQSWDWWDDLKLPVPTMDNL